MSQQEREPTEEELRAAYEAELKRVRVEDVVIQTVVSLINLGGRKAGLAPGTEDERDFEQVRQAVDAVRALLPLVEGDLGPDAARVREALSQLQMVYAQGVGAAPGAGAPGTGATTSTGSPRPPGPTEAPSPPRPEGTPGSGSAQRSGRLWIPGQ